MATIRDHQGAERLGHFVRFMAELAAWPHCRLLSTVKMMSTVSVGNSVRAFIHKIIDKMAAIRHQ